MAGLIARLFGGSASPAVDTDPAPGVGGYDLGAGPANQTGFPGSTSQTRTFPSDGSAPYSPRSARMRLDWDTDANSRSGTTPETRQSSSRADQRRGSASPRDTPWVTVPQTAIRQEMQHNSPREWYGGPAMKTTDVSQNDTAGGYIDRTGAYSMGLQSADSRDTTTPWTAAQPEISGNVPGSQNVRNQVAQRYKNKPGDMHTYRSRSRPDQAQVNMGGQATDGNTDTAGIYQEVTVPSRFVFGDGGVQSWSVQREMPYGGRGNGARGADLNGQRYYATGQETQFWNAGQGDYGIARQRATPSPVSFTQPAPWSAGVYTTTASVGTADDPNSAPAQQPDDVYISPVVTRASRGSSRRG
jgi:hypothetical protein